jgi:hypothetical protein
MSRFVAALADAFTRLSERDRRALRIGLALLAPALLWAAAVRPYHAALVDARERLAAEQALLDREEALVARAAELPVAIERATRAAARAEARLIHASNVLLAEAQLTSYVETVATLSRVLLQEMRGLEVREEAPGGVRPIRLAIRGESDLEGVLTFLERIEQSPLLVRVAGLSVEPELERPSRGRRDAGGPPQPTGVVRFNLIVQAYAPPETRPESAL